MLLTLLCCNYTLHWLWQPVVAVKNCIQLVIDLVIILWWWCHHIEPNYKWLFLRFRMKPFFFLSFLGSITTITHLYTIVDYSKISELKVYWRLNILHGLNIIILDGQSVFLVFYALNLLEKHGNSFYRFILWDTIIFFFLNSTFNQA